MASLTIEMFSEDEEYDFSGFDCGEGSLNLFLTSHLARQHGARILRGYLLLTKDPRPKVVGFYTLSGSCFEKETLPSNTQKRKVPYANVPSITLGRLAIHKDLQGQEWGTTLVTHAMRVVYQASQAVGIHGIFVDALNEKAKRFYLSLGFVSLTGDNANSLFYPTKSIEKLFE
ncbi:GNAT family N-acetyltransferase [Scandinavium goeteborgense]|uniref:GNAT family N-acetyltransferase n=1 Tax=Scandinavium goeteborgense TaxID=1851514 RepID=UPI0037F6A10C